MSTSLTKTPNENNRTVTISNPSLLPQTATNWDATLEYYFEPVGSVSVGWFHKTIKDYIVNGINAGTVASGNNNGFNGEKDGFTILTRANAGTATVQGWVTTPDSNQGIAITSVNSDGPKFRRLTLALEWPDVRDGESVAVNGVCLTVSARAPGSAVEVVEIELPPSAKVDYRMDSHAPYSQHVVALTGDRDAR